MADLSTSFAGLPLRNPLVVSPNPMGTDIELMKRLEAAGASAIVLPSLFEEQIEHEELEVDRLLASGSESYVEALSYFPELDDYRTGPESYLELIAAAKKALSIPVIGSLNGVSTGGWIRYAKLIQEAGADALELNEYVVAAEPTLSSGALESSVLELVRAVRAEIDIPLAVKIAPYWTAFAHLATQIAEAGADGLVLFNRFVQPDIDLDTFEVRARVQLSTPSELLLRLRWIAILRGRVDASLAGTGGVHTAEDALKLVAAGADVTQMCSALLRHGPGRLAEVLEGMESWLDVNEYESVEQLKGSMSQAFCPEPAAFERAGYMQALVHWTGKKW